MQKSIQKENFQEDSGFDPSKRSIIHITNVEEQVEVSAQAPSVAVFLLPNI